MPFQSEKQRRYLHANHPEIAQRWEKEYSDGGIAALNAQLNQLPEYYLPLANGGYAMQGGVKNYLGNQKMVHAPKNWKSAPDHPETELTYITEPEKELLVKADLHGSLNGNVNRGPEGIASLNGGEIYDMKSSSSSTNTGGGGGDNREKYIATQYNKPKKKKVVAPPGEKGGPGYIEKPKKKIIKTKDKEPPIKKKKKKKDLVDTALETVDIADKFYRFGTTFNPLQLYKTNPYIFGGSILKGLYDKNKKKKKKPDASEISTSLDWEDPKNNPNLAWDERDGWVDLLTGEKVKAALPDATQAKALNIENLLKGDWSKEKIDKSKFEKGWSDAVGYEKAWKNVPEGITKEQFIKDALDKKYGNMGSAVLEKAIQGGGVFPSEVLDQFPKSSIVYGSKVKPTVEYDQGKMFIDVDEGELEGDAVTKLTEKGWLAKGGIANHFKRKKFNTGSEPVIGDALFRGNWNDYSNEQLQMMFPDWDPEIESIDEHIKNKQSLNADFAAVTEGNGILDLTEGDETTEVVSTEENEVIPDLLAPGSASGILAAHGGRILPKGPAGITSLNGWGDKDEGFADKSQRAGERYSQPTYHHSVDTPDQKVAQKSIDEAKRKAELKNLIEKGPGSTEEKYDTRPSYLGEEFEEEYYGPRLSQEKKKILTAKTKEYFERNLKKLDPDKYYEGMSALEKAWNFDLPPTGPIGILIAMYNEHKLTSEGKDLLEEWGQFVGGPPGSNPQTYDDLWLALEKRKAKYRNQNVEESDGEGPTVPLPPTIQLLEDEMMASGMSNWDRIKANQAKRAMLVEKGIIQDNPVVDESITDITMQANSGGLANLFRVKNQ